MTIDKCEGPTIGYNRKRVLLKLLSILCLMPVLICQSQTRRNEALPKNAKPMGQPQQLPLVRKQTDETKSESRTLRMASPPARITFQEGLLTVHSQGGDLTDILRDVASLSGMLIDGSVQSSHVYGDYGPASPLNVLTDLLSGSGYNFMMVGTTNDGAPRELLLSQRSGEPSQSPAAQVRQPKREMDHVPEDSGEQLGPGAIPNMPPPPSEDPQVRMQQNLQKLTHMHEHQTQTNQPQ